MTTISFADLQCLEQWRSPQEYRDDPLDEKIDVWSLGMNMVRLSVDVLPTNVFTPFSPVIPVRFINGCLSPVQSLQRETSH